ncbi:MAG: CpaF family protein [Solirubrobacterales bacterium]|nr:CpaF family protein [Solirubrobacterales bacterium]MCB8970478.1 CpaF family protein [Thermoleophilales bacterium]MCO5325639.1 CpaF family protein [Solirubrobacterales bacterium]
MSPVDHVENLSVELRGRLIERRRAAAVARDGDRAELPVAVREVVDQHAALLSEERREELADRVLRDTVGLGPLEELLRDPEVEEVMVNGHEEVWIERRGRLERTEVSFADEGQLRDVIERVLGPIGRRVDELSPMADGRLADGSRVNVIIPPLSVGGPAVSIRRFAGIRPSPYELLRRGSVDAELLELLRAAIAGHRNLVVSGGTGSGKTTVLNALSSFIEPGERIITIEDAAELSLQQPHVVRLESRPPGIEGSGEVSIRDLVRNALRMRPDRILIGEVRGAEAMDLLVALNTGHRGALSTVHANGPGDALRRIETLAMMAGLGVPHDVVRAQLAGAIDLVLHLERGAEGSRFATTLAEVLVVAGAPAVREVWVRDEEVP